MKLSIFLLVSLFLALVNAYKGQNYNRLSKEEKGSPYWDKINGRILSCTQQDDLTGIPGKCNQYKTCENGLLKNWLCPKNYVFDSIMKACSPKHLTPNGCSNQI